jgi:hypothetical protein
MWNFVKCSNTIACELFCSKTTQVPHLHFAGTNLQGSYLRFACTNVFSSYLHWSGSYLTMFIPAFCKIKLWTLVPGKCSFEPCKFLLYFTIISWCVKNAGITSVHGTCSLDICEHHKNYWDFIINNSLFLFWKMLRYQ